MTDRAYLAWRLNRTKLPLVADGLAVAVAISLPWSTSATGILVVLWLVALVPTLDVPQLRRVLGTPAGGLPVLLCLLAVVGMLWAFDLPFKERLGGLSSYAKLLIIPLLFAQFVRSERAGWVVTGYLAACGVLLVTSWISLLSWLLCHCLMLAPHAPGIVVKDHIAQGGEFAACALFLAPVALRAWMNGRHSQAVGALAAAVCFVGNVIYIGTSRTGLVVTAALLVLFAWKFLNRKARIGFAIALVVVGAASWPVAINLRNNVASFIHEMQTYDPSQDGSRSGERLVYWQKALAMVASAPLIGHGTGSIRDQFRRSAEGQTGASADISTNPHNQTFAVAIQLGLLGVAVLFAMWGAHLILFRGEGLAAWFGFAIVVQNLVGSLFNSHLFDFTQGWSYVVGVGVAGGVMMKNAEGAAVAEERLASPDAGDMMTRHVAVIVLYDAEGRMLLQHRTKDAPTFPDCWALFGGGIEEGETPEQAVKRECMEELSYELSHPRHFKVHTVRHEGMDYVIHLFTERYNGAELTLGEGQGLGWFLAEETHGLRVTDHDRAIIQSVAQETRTER